MTYLQRLLPDKGLYCVAMALTNGGFRHYFYPTIKEVQGMVDDLERRGHTVYVAQASFDEQIVRDAQAHNQLLPKTLSKEERRLQRKKERAQGNATHLKNFFLDIDCGEKWPLKNQMEGAAALKDFLKKTNLPMPSVVNSGNGLYAQWILTNAIPAHQWKTVAQILKQVVQRYTPALGADSTRTSDSASVLRPPGTTNKKPGKDAKMVRLVSEAPPVDFLEFTKKLGVAAGKKNGDSAPIKITSLQTPKPIKDINADFYAGLEYQSVPSSAEKISSRCNQIAAMRDSGGDIPEPLWYGCIGVLVFCEEGDDLIHKWSAGHSGYDYHQTEEKIDQWRNGGMGPSTCLKLGGDNPSGCIGCPSNGKIKSPIVLGRPEPKEIILPEEEQSAIPDGFKRGDDGLYVQEEDRWVRFYDQDLYVDRLAWDESLGYEVMTIKHHLPYEGEMECTIRSSTVNDPKALTVLLSDNHIKSVGVKEKKLMQAYLESYAAKLQRQRRMTMLLCQMGWKKTRKGDDMFILGKRILHADGTQENASMARNVPKAAEGFRVGGSLDKWVDATKVLGRPSLEPYAFALLCGFAAPLMKFTGYDGALVSMVGDSGAGKTLMMRMALSIWGYAEDLILLRGDTDNGLVARLGVYNNLPMAIDEMTNSDNKALSEMAYRLTQGRDKVRLTRNSEEKKNINTWNTIALTSSNSSLVDKLADLKHDASAEINRIFEYSVLKNPRFEGEVTKDIYWTVKENFGHAGVEYAKYLVRIAGQIPAGLDNIRTRIDLEANVQSDERFWSAVVSCAIYGGLIASRLGLIKFPVAPVMSWAVDRLVNMRDNKVELTTDPLNILGQFLDEHAANRLIVQGLGKAGAGCQIVEVPRGPLVVRIDLTRKRLLISRSVFKTWLARKMGSYRDVMTSLLKSGTLLEANKRRVLGAGTQLAGTQVAVWELDMTNRRFSDQMSDFVEVTEMLAKDGKEL